MDQQIEILFKEYEAVRTYVDSLGQAPTFVMTAAYSLIVGMLAFTGSKKRILSFFVTFGVPVLLIWIAFSVNTMNASGLRLVEIEQQINRIAEFKAGCGLQWYSRMICAGETLFIGNIPLTIFLWLIIGPIMVGASRLNWLCLLEGEADHILRKEEPTKANDKRAGGPKISRNWRIAIVAFPYGLLLATLIVLLWTDARYKSQKQEIISRYELPPSIQSATP